ncbi:MAG: hypothetical protein D3917_03850 [Candidatus Electrothrix sp. AX5]|nr:hypothetical protein [Candidatus Electrothrix sp. AX5]
MAYKRRASQIIADAQERATNPKVITLDPGWGLTVATFDEIINYCPNYLGDLQHPDGLGRCSTQIARYPVR